MQLWDITFQIHHQVAGLGLSNFLPDKPQFSITSLCTLENTKSSSSPLYSVKSHHLNTEDYQPCLLPSTDCQWHSKHLLWSDQLSEQGNLAMKSGHLSTMNILNINTSKINTINVFRRQDSCQYLVIKMFSSLTHGKALEYDCAANICIFAWCQHAETCMLLGATHRSMSNPWGSQMQKHLGSTSLLHGILLSWFENNQR